MAIKVGVIGLGMMGCTHLDVYAKLEGVEVAAVADKNPKRLSGEEKAVGNVEGQAQGGFDFASVKKYEDGMELIADESIDLVDICLVTPLHLEYAKAAFAAGKHVLVEKPLARTLEDARAIVAASETAKGLSMPAMCMRFWPEWSWLKDAVAQNTYGKVLSAHFSRLASHPGGPFYSDGKACGGALLDLHIHDSDFVQYCFGVPDAVMSRGYSKISGEPDHVMTQYLYEDGPMVSAEGGWSLSDGYGFTMRYVVNFEKATAMFDIGGEPTLKLIQDGKSEAVKVRGAMGYEIEIEYMVDCIKQGKKPETVTLASAAESVRLVEAENKSIATGNVVTL